VNIEINDFAGNILQSQFYACFYILLSDTQTHPKRRFTYTYLRRGYPTLSATGAEAPNA